MAHLLLAEDDVDIRYTLKRLLEHIGQGIGILWYDQGGTGRCNPGILSAKGVGPGEKGVAGRRAGGGRAVAAGELQSFLGQAVDMRSFQVFVFRTVAPEVSIA